MSLWRRKVVVVGLDAEMVATASGEAKSVADAIDCSLADVLRELLVGHRGAVLALAGADLCRHWTEVPPAGVASLAELRAIAAAHCCHLFGGVAADWRIVGDWSLRRPFVCAALPAAVVAALETGCARAGLRLRLESALLKAARVLEPRLPEDGWSAWQTPASLVLLRRERGRVIWLQASRRGVHASAEALIAQASSQISRQCLRSGEPAPGWLAWLDAGPDGVLQSTAAANEATALPIRRVDCPPRWPAGRNGASEAHWAAAVAAAG